MALMTARTHLVLGGGGAMGAFQVGALLALLEGGVVPDSLLGCSAGALNAAFLASRPDLERARELATWWLDPTLAAVLSPGWRSHARGLAALARGGGRGLLDARPLTRLIARNVQAHDLSELAVPVMATTTCLDCGAARYHDRGPAIDVLLASCSLPGLLAPVRLPDGHLHVDGGIADGVPVAAALDRAGPQDRVLVLDCGLAAITGRVGSCAAVSDGLRAQVCGVPVAPGRPRYVAPEETSVAAFDVVLRAFTVARDLANRAAVKDALDDPRVQVAPHIADAWAAGLLTALPRGPRDMSHAHELLRAGHRATELWLRSRTWITSGPVSQS
jgi:predicted acylesterase/phospholipase RssA